jgi:Carboxypeptidase regulatory-like domain
LNLPAGQNIYIRARGFYQTGYFNGSESITESVRNVLFTAALANITGRVITRDGRAVFNAQATITDANGQTRYATTNPSGYFRFTNVAADGVYVVSIRSKRYLFAPQIVTAAANATSLIFAAL